MSSTSGAGGSTGGSGGSSAAGTTTPGSRRTAGGLSSPSPTPARVRTGAGSARGAGTAGGSSTSRGAGPQHQPTGFVKTLKSDIDAEEGLKRLETVCGQDAIFSDLTADDLKLLSRIFSFINVKVGGAIFRKGDPATFLALVVQGTAAVYVGNEKRPVGVGSLIGEVAYFEGGRRTLDVGAETDCQLAVIFYDGIDQLDKTFPQLYRKLLKILGRAMARKMSSDSAARDKGAVHFEADVKSVHFERQQTQNRFSASMGDRPSSPDTALGDGDGGLYPPTSPRTADTSLLSNAGDSEAPPLAEGTSPDLMSSDSFTAQGQTPQVQARRVSTGPFIRSESFPNSIPGSTASAAATVDPSPTDCSPAGEALLEGRVEAGYAEVIATGVTPTSPAIAPLNPYYRGNQVKQLLAEVEQLRKEKEEMKKRRVESQSLVRRVKELEDEQKKLENEIKELKESLRTKDDDLTQLQDVLRQKTKELDDARAISSYERDKLSTALSREREHVKDLEKQLDISQKHCSELYTSEKQASQQLLECQALLARREEEAKRLKEEVSTADARVKHLTDAAEQRYLEWMKLFLQVHVRANGDRFRYKRALTKFLAAHVLRQFRTRKALALLYEAVLQLMARLDGAILRYVPRPVGKVEYDFSGGLPLSSLGMYNTPPLLKPSPPFLEEVALDQQKHVSRYRAARVRQREAFLAEFGRHFYNTDSDAPASVTVSSTGAGPTNSANAASVSAPADTSDTTPPQAPEQSPRHVEAAAAAAARRDALQAMTTIPSPLPLPIPRTEAAVNHASEWASRVDKYINAVLNSSPELHRRYYEKKLSALQGEPSAVTRIEMLQKLIGEFATRVIVVQGFIRHWYSTAHAFVNGNMALIQAQCEKEKIREGRDAELAALRKEVEELAARNSALEQEIRTIQSAASSRRAKAYLMHSSATNSAAHQMVYVPRQGDANTSVPRPVTQTGFPRTPLVPSTTESCQIAARLSEASVPKNVSAKRALQMAFSAYPSADHLPPNVSSHSITLPGLYQTQTTPSSTTTGSPYLESSLRLLETKGKKGRPRTERSSTTELYSSRSHLEGDESLSLSARGRLALSQKQEGYSLADHLSLRPRLRILPTRAESLPPDELEFALGQPSERGQSRGRPMSVASSHSPGAIENAKSPKSDTRMITNESIGMTRRSPGSSIEQASPTAKSSSSGPTTSHEKDHPDTSGDGKLHQEAAKPRVTNKEALDDYDDDFAIDDFEDGGAGALPATAASAIAACYERPGTAAAGK